MPGNLILEMLIREISVKLVKMGNFPLANGPNPGKLLCRKSLEMRLVGQRNNIRNRWAIV